MDTRYPNLFDASNTDWSWYTGEAFLTAWLTSILDLAIPENQRTSQAIARNFQSCNKIAEVVDRHIAALSPSRLSVPSNFEAMLDRWEQENAGEHGSPLEEAALKAKIDGRSYLRLFFRKNHTTNTAPDALLLHCPRPQSITPYRDYDGFLTMFDYAYQEGTERYVERQFLRENLTIFQTIYKEEVTREFALDLGGKFTIAQVNLPKLLTASLKQNQNAINFAMTLLPHNLAYSGWIQESILNGQPPGKWEFNSAGQEQFTPNQEGLLSGAGITRFIQGLPLRDERDNLIGYTQPQIQLQNPIDPKTFVETFRAFSLAIYEQCDQAFVLGADLPLSGISREQSRKDFEATISKDARLLSYAYSDLFTAANYLLGNKESVRVKVQPKIASSIEQKQLLLTARQQLLVSKRTAITQLGFASDVDAEIAELDAEAKITIEKPAVVNGGLEGEIGNSVNSINPDSAIGGG